MNRQDATLGIGISGIVLVVIFVATVVLTFGFRRTRRTVHFYRRFPHFPPLSHTFLVRLKDIWPPSYASIASILAAGSHDAVVASTSSVAATTGNASRDTNGSSTGGAWLHNANPFNHIEKGGGISRIIRSYLYENVDTYAYVCLSKSNFSDGVVPELKRETIENSGWGCSDGSRFLNTYLSKIESEMFEFEKRLSALREYRHSLLLQRYKRLKKKHPHLLRAVSVAISAAAVSYYYNHQGASMPIDSASLAAALLLPENIGIIKVERDSDPILVYIQLDLARSQRDIEYLEEQIKIKYHSLLHFKDFAYKSFLLLEKAAILKEDENDDLYGGGPDGHGLISSDGTEPPISADRYRDKIDHGHGQSTSFYHSTLSGSAKLPWQTVRDYAQSVLQKQCPHDVDLRPWRTFVRIYEKARFGEYEISRSDYIRFMVALRQVLSLGEESSSPLGTGSLPPVIADVLLPSPASPAEEVEVYGSLLDANRSSYRSRPGGVFLFDREAAGE